MEDDRRSSRSSRSSKSGERKISTSRQGDLAAKKSPDCDDCVPETCLTEERNSINNMLNSQSETGSLSSAYEKIVTAISRHDARDTTQQKWVQNDKSVEFTSGNVVLLQKQENVEQEPPKRASQDRRASDQERRASRQSQSQERRSLVEQVVAELDEARRPSSEAKRVSIQGRQKSFSRKDLQLKEAEQAIENKDVLIKILQDQVKKMEDSYKNNLKETEEYRYKYCQASEEINKLKSCCNKPEHKPIAAKIQVPDEEMKSLKREFVKWKHECEQLLQNSGGCKPQDVGLKPCTDSNANTLCACPLDVLGSVLQKIASQKNALSELNTPSTKCVQPEPIDEDTRQRTLSEILNLRQQINKLKEENLKLREQELQHAECQLFMKTQHSNVCCKPTGNFCNSCKKSESYLMPCMDMNDRDRQECGVARTVSNYSQETENYNFTMTEKQGVKSVSAERIYIHANSQSVTPRDDGRNEQIVEKIMEINSKFEHLERKEEQYFIELKSLSERILQFSESMTTCLQEINNLKENLKDVKQGSNNEMCKNGEIFDNLSSEIGQLKKELCEVREKVDTLVNHVKECQEIKSEIIMQQQGELQTQEVQVDPKPVVNAGCQCEPEPAPIVVPPVIVPEPQEPEQPADDKAVSFPAVDSNVSESKITIENMENPDEGSLSKKNVISSKSMVLDQPDDKVVCMNLPANYEVLKKHYEILQNEKSVKEEQIKLMRDLLDECETKKEELCKPVSNVAVCAPCSSKSGQDCCCENAEEKINSYMEKIMQENANLKSTIYNFMDCLRNKICGIREKPDKTPDETEIKSECLEPPKTEDEVPMKLSKEKGDQANVVTRAAVLNKSKTETCDCAVGKTPEKDVLLAKEPVEEPVSEKIEVAPTAPEVPSKSAEAPSMKQDRTSTCTEHSSQCTCPGFEDERTKGTTREGVASPDVRSKSSQPQSLKQGQNSTCTGASKCTCPGFDDGVESVKKNPTANLQMQTIVDSCNCIDEETSEELLKDMKCDPPKTEVQIEDIYKSVKCSCQSLNEKYAESMTHWCTNMCSQTEEVAKSLEKLSKGVGTCGICDDLFNKTSCQAGSSRPTYEPEKSKQKPLQQYCTMPKITCSEIERILTCDSGTFRCCPAQQTQQMSKEMEKYVCCGSLAAALSGVGTSSEMRKLMCCTSNMPGPSSMPPPGPARPLMPPHKERQQEMRGTLCNLENYFDYLQQQLEVICNIEGQIEEMKSEVSTKHEPCRC